MKDSVSLATLLFAVIDAVVVVVELAHRQALLLNTPSVASLELLSDLLLVFFCGERGFRLLRVG